MLALSMSAPGNPDPKTAPGTSISEPLARLRRGEISVEDYVDFCTEHATQHLAEIISADQLSAVRQVVALQLQTDPVLAEYFRRATGRDPEPGSEAAVGEVMDSGGHSLDDGLISRRRG